jgi:hypothetical protein
MHKSKFIGSFSASEIQLSIPSCLLHLVKMIEHGHDIKSQLENDRWKSDLTTAQLLMFNYHPNINKRTVQDILLRVKLHFLFTWGCLFMPNVIYQQRNLGERVFVLVELPWWIPNLHINAWSLCESCHSAISRARQANVQWLTL